MRLLAAILFLAASPAALAAPSEITAEYRVSKDGMTIGRVNETFVRKGDSYAIESITRTEGLLKVFMDEEIILQSTGKVVATGLQPLEFGQRRIGHAHRDVKATFDWDRGVMRSMYRGESAVIPLPVATQDRLSLMYQFMSVQRDKAPRLVVPMSNGRRVELYTYRLVEEVRVSTPAGEFDTVHYERVTQSAKEARAEVWLAKDHFYFPVRVVFDDPRGLKLEQTIVALQAR